MNRTGKRMTGKWKKTTPLQHLLATATQRRTVTAAECAAAGILRYGEKALQLGKGLRPGLVQHDARIVGENVAPAKRVVRRCANTHRTGESVYKAAWGERQTFEAHNGAASCQL
jgi:hypothetical protein